MSSNFLCCNQQEITKWNQAVVDFLCKLRMANNSKTRNESDPRKESAREAAIWWQKVLNTLQTSFHPTCEFPFCPRTPTAAAAPLAEKRSPTMCKSRTVSASAHPSFPFRLTIVDRTRDAAAYAHATVFDTTKYLQAKNFLVIYSKNSQPKSKNREKFQINYTKTQILKCWNF